MSEKRKELLRAVKFTLFSVSAAIIQVASFALFNDVFHWNYWAGYLTSLVLSVLWHFTMNRKITFQSANNVPIAMLKVAVFYVVFTPLSAWAGDLLTGTYQWPDYLVLALSMIANFVLEYIYDRFVVFGGSIDTAVTAKE